MTAPLLAVVVVTWNAARLVGPCLAALAAQSLPAGDYEVWVVDNASTDGTPELVARDWPAVRLLRQDRNLGFAGGCNAALRELAAPFAVLVNPDAVVDRDFLAALAGRVRAPGAERVAAVTAKVLLAPRFVPAPPGSPGGTELADGRWAVPVPAGQQPPGAVDVINSTGNELRADGLAQDRGWLCPDTGQGWPAEVFGFYGGAALLRVAALAEAGWFAEEFFLYYEDTDLSWRLRLLGWTVAFEPAALARHEHSASAGEGSALHLRYGDRNRLLMHASCAPGGTAAGWLGRYLLTTASGLRREGWPWRRTRLRLQSLAGYLRLLPWAVRRRRALARTARVPRAAVARLAVAAGPGRSYRGPG